LGKTTSHWASKYGGLNFLQTLWEFAKEKLTTEEIKNNLLLLTVCERRTAWLLAAEWDILGTLQLLWEWAEEKLTTEEIKNKLLLGTDCEG